MSRTLAAVSRGDAELPLRTGMPLPCEGGVLVMMPGFLGSEASAGIKLLSLAPKQAGRSSHLGVMMLYDASLLPVAMLCGSTITALRTAATTACATDILAPKTARRSSERAGPARDWRGNDNGGCAGLRRGEVRWLSVRVIEDFSRGSGASLLSEEAS